MTSEEPRLRRYQALLAPGTQIREGLERIVHGRTGALVVLGTNPKVERASTGGFGIDVPFTPTALRELAKMDGGIVLSSDLSRILAAGVHLSPDASIETVETGTRHRTADRLARQARIPVVTVSASMGTIALFLDGKRHPVERSEQIFTRADQALAALARYRERLLDVAKSLSAQEVADQVTVRDVASVAQRLELVRRLEAELEGLIVALGVDGRLVALQLHELTIGLGEMNGQLELDYRPEGDVTFGTSRLAGLAMPELLDVGQVAAAMGFGSTLEERLSPRGYRQLAQIGRLPAALAPRLVTHFGGLQELLGASVAELREVEGVGVYWARTIRDGLVRLSDAAYDN